MTNKYKCLNKNIFLFEDYKLLPLRRQDIQNIREWRNKQIEVLRQNKILTEQEQIFYYENIITPLFAKDRPAQIVFSFLKNDICIGYGGLVHISWEDQRGELSFLLNPDRVADKEVYNKEFSIFIKLILKIGFQQLNLNRIFTETYNIRDYHVSILESNGFIREGVLREHVKISGKYFDSIIHSCLKEDFNG